MAKTVVKIGHRRTGHMTNAPKKTSAKAPELVKKSEHNDLVCKIIKLESFIETLLWDVKGERGEALRRRFYGD